MTGGQPRVIPRQYNYLPEWMDRARCRGERIDPKWFFPGKGFNAKKAREVCEHCPVVVDCLAYALDMDEKHGVWGGTTNEDREVILKYHKDIHERGNA